MFKENRYIGGGRLYFTPVVNGVPGTEFEIGEIQSASLNFNVTTVDAFSNANVMKVLVAKVVKDITSTIKFSTQKIDLENTSMAMLGTSETETFAIGDTLPDGTTATAETIVPVIKAGENPLIEGKLRFVGDEDGDTKPVLIIYNAVITPTSDMNYISDEFTKIEFEGAVLKTDDGYAKEYRMTVN